MDWIKAVEDWLAVLYMVEGIVIIISTLLIYLLEKDKSNMNVVIGLIFGAGLLPMGLDSFGHYKYYSLVFVSSCCTLLQIIRLYRAIIRGHLTN